MSDKLNCWEFKNCGRELGGDKCNELGICPASIANQVDGINEGKNGGRACWAIAGTLCGGTIQGTHALKLLNCRVCEFYSLVIREEGINYIGSKGIIEKLKSIA